MPEASVQTAPIKEPDLVAQIIVTLVKYWVFILLGFVALIVIVSIVLILKKMKKHIDPFAEEYKKVKALCKFQKDPTIREVYMVSDFGLKHIGHYMGEAITQDGYKNILFWKFKRWYLFWFPARLDFFDVVKETMLIRCNVNNSFSYMEYDKDTKQEAKKTIQLTKDLITKSEDKILVKGFGMERVRYFLYPVLRDKEGNTIDKGMEIFERERTPALISTMYQQAEDFANVSRELINLNPSVRMVRSTEGQLNPTKRIE
jgi:hypothetical protein